MSAVSLDAKPAAPLSRFVDAEEAPSIVNMPSSAPTFRTGPRRRTGYLILPATNSPITVCPFFAYTGKMMSVQLPRLRWKSGFWLPLAMS